MSVFNLLHGSLVGPASAGGDAGGGAPPDVTPTVTGTWSNISDTVTGVGNTGNVTISDINQGIDLYWTNGGGDSDSITVKYSVNDNVVYTTLSEGSANTVTVSNNDTIKWQVETFSGSIESGTITISNDSDGGATVGNTFTYSLRVV